MPRYPDRERRYVYWCEDCGERIPAFQGLFWFVRERDDGIVEVPYCPECGSTAIASTRD